VYVRCLSPLYAQAHAHVHVHIACCIRCKTQTMTVTFLLFTAMYHPYAIYFPAYMSAS
jgi:hypothetical protein